MTAPPGKRVGENVYIHVDALSRIDALKLQQIRSAETLAGVEAGTQYNLVRMHADGVTIALLSYPHFFDDPFPSLRERWLVDLDKRAASYRTYADSLNPPILHRKELLLPSDDVRRERFAELTTAAETIGLFDEPKRIGYRRQWDQLISLLPLKS